MFLEIILQSIDNPNTYVETVHDLVFIGKQAEPIFDPESDDPIFQADPELSDFVNDTETTHQKKKEVVNYWKGCVRGLRKFESVQNRFRFVTHRFQLYRWAKQIEQGGTYKRKLTQISEHVLQRFVISLLA